MEEPPFSKISRLKHSSYGKLSRNSLNTPCACLVTDIILDRCQRLQQSCLTYREVDISPALANGICGVRQKVLESTASKFIICVHVIQSFPRKCIKLISPISESSVADRSRLGSRSSESEGIWLMVAQWPASLKLGVVVCLCNLFHERTSTLLKWTLLKIDDTG